MSTRWSCSAPGRIDHLQYHLRRQYHQVWIIHILEFVCESLGMRASSCIDLLVQIKLKKACINVHNSDNECFKWTILLALHSDVLHPECVINVREFANELNFDGIEFSDIVKNISKFEILCLQAKLCLRNVYGLTKKYCNYIVSPLHLLSVFFFSPLHLTAEKRARYICNTL